MFTINLVGFLQTCLDTSINPNKLKGGGSAFNSYDFGVDRYGFLLSIGIKSVLVALHLTSQ